MVLVKINALLKQLDNILYGMLSIFRKMCKEKEINMSKQINLIIDGNKVTVPEGTTILNAAREARS